MSANGSTAIAERSSTAAALMAGAADLARATLPDNGAMN
jgi:hypothetical protein